MSSQVLVVLTTCASAGDAERIGSLLVERQLAACVNLSDVVSIYRWQGALQQERETLLVIKTTEARLAAVEQAIKEHSSYELPEVIAIPVHTGTAEYLDWLRASVADG